jgi:hypothetical protein
VIGVHSTGSLNCTDIGTDTRVDAYGSWVAAQMTKGVYGSMCQGPTDCVSGLCLNTGSGASYRKLFHGTPYAEMSTDTACARAAGKGPRAE